MNRQAIQIVWFRRDLRLIDNKSIEATLKVDLPVLPLFIFDSDILNRLEDKKDRRVDYIHQAVDHMQTELAQRGGRMMIFHGTALEAFEHISMKYHIVHVHAGEDYEPEAIERDSIIAAFLKKDNGALHLYKDQAIFAKNDIVKADKSPYTVFTPYSKRWKEVLSENDLIECKGFLASTKFVIIENLHFPSLKELGFEKTDTVYTTPFINEEIVANYTQQRDFPAIEGTTQLGMALRFGTISTRRCVLFAREKNETWLNELIWREFFMQILYHFPKVQHQCFKAKYEGIQWLNNSKDFELWCSGNTGYSIVDAGMRQLNATGFMHNRVRMIVASFLCKHLLIDWRWGESYFASKLNDYDLSANNGNWQWSAGCGCDAAPYFRIFNPITQADKFDPKHEYRNKWLPSNYASIPRMVDHDFARKRCLEVYKLGIME